MEIDSLKYPERAKAFLAKSLADGTLTLFLGAGVSLGAGLPDWYTLVGRLYDEVGLSSESLENSADSLQRGADEVRRRFKGSDRDFAELVQTCLYRGVELDETLLRDNLLIALAGLMMGSRRGSVKRVVTFNFDGVLEWYISLYGFVPRVILQPPVDEGAEDIRIYHPHGFLPHPKLGLEASDFVMFDQKSINVRLGEPHDEWISLLRHVLCTGVALFVGLSESSFRDRAIAPLLAKAGAQLQRRRPLGFWVLKSKEEDRELLTQEFLEYNVIALHLSSFDEVPKLLLDICQKAGQSVHVSK